MAGAAALADAAGHAVHDDDPRAVVELAGDLVPQHRSRRATAELLDVGPAQPARTDADAQAGAARLGDVGEPGAAVGI